MEETPLLGCQLCIPLSRTAKNQTGHHSLSAAARGGNGKRTCVALHNRPPWRVFGPGATFRLSAKPKTARTIPHRFRPEMITAQIPHKTWFSHIPAQIFLHIIAPRCNKTLAIRGKISYQYKQLTAQMSNERQL
jgi:hypothetical protein